MTAHVDPLERGYDSARPIRTFFCLMGAGPGAQLWQLTLFALKMVPQLILPVVIAESIRLASERPADAIAQLGWLFGVYFVTLFANIPFHMLFVRGSSRIVRRMELRLRSALVRRLQQLSMSFHNERERGRLQSKVLRDVEQLVQLGELYFLHAMGAAIGLCFAFGYTLWRDPVVALGFFVATPLAVGMMRLFHGAMGRRNDALRSNVESMSQRVLEMIDMVPVTRAHGLEEIELNKVGRKLGEVRDQGRRVDIVNALFGASAFVVFMGAVAGVTYGVTRLVLADRVALDKIALYAALFQMVVGSVQAILNLLPQVAKGFSSIRSIGEVLECPDLEENAGKQVVERVEGAFDFRDVTYTYPGAHAPAIRALSLRVEAGRCVAFVGASGSGKSTLMQLSIGFLRPSAGEIYLDGQPMSALDMRTWRRHIAVVPQHTILFSGTLRENITYGLPNIRDEQVEAAVEAANLRAVVDELPDGLHTRVGENGLKLSGGQRQRVAIARAIVRDPAVIILDEATSALDVIAEHEVQRAIERLIERRTTFIVAHRLSTIRHADTIVVMREGRAIEVGTHKELIARGGVFSELQALQFARAPMGIG